MGELLLKVKKLDVLSVFGGDCFHVFILTLIAVVSGLLELTAKFFNVLFERLAIGCCCLDFGFGAVAIRLLQFKFELQLLNLPFELGLSVPELANLRLNGLVVGLRFDSFPYFLLDLKGVLFKLCELLDDLLLLTGELLVKRL